MIVFEGETTKEIIGQLVGAASMTRFWSRQAQDYPNTAGVFQDQNAKELVDAAMAALKKLPSGA